MASVTGGGQKRAYASISNDSGLEYAETAKIGALTITRSLTMPKQSLDNLEFNVRRINNPAWPEEGEPQYLYAGSSILLPFDRNANIVKFKLCPTFTQGNAQFIQMQAASEPTACPSQVTYLGDSFGVYIEGVIHFDGSARNHYYMDVLHTEAGVGPRGTRQSGFIGDGRDSIFIEFVSPILTIASTDTANADRVDHPTGWYSVEHIYA